MSQLREVADDFLRGGLPRALDQFLGPSSGYEEYTPVTQREFDRNVTAQARGAENQRALGDDVPNNPRRDDPATFGGFSQQQLMIGAVGLGAVLLLGVWAVSR